MVQNTLEAVNLVGPTLLNNTSADDPPLLFVTEQVSVALEKRSLSQMNGTTIRASENSSVAVQLPDFTSVIGDILGTNSTDTTINIEVRIWYNYHEFSIYYLSDYVNVFWKQYESRRPISRLYRQGQVRKPIGNEVKLSGLNAHT